VTVKQVLSDEFDRTLSEIEALQARETEVLRTMNRAALDDITSEKEILCERLRRLGAEFRPEPRHRAALERVRRQATSNQLLLIHARDAVRAILSQVTGAQLDGLPGIRKPFVQEGVRLNVRG
jgi:hypothetical protein